eukprot:7382388-Lingulodinium_polyedra.AAC.1
MSSFEEEEILAADLPDPDWESIMKLPSKPRGALGLRAPGRRRSRSGSLNPRFTLAPLEAFEA